jgi:hypothetical protein
VEQQCGSSALDYMWKVRWEHGLSERGEGEAGGKGRHVERLNNGWSNDIEGGHDPGPSKRRKDHHTCPDRDDLVQTHRDRDGEDSYGDTGRGEVSGDRYGMMVDASDPGGEGSDGRRKRSRSKDRDRDREKRRRSKSPRDEGDGDR